ncbi:MAG: hypothetical protein GEV11_06580 [Streptosporangiales bacterium]|nr:hypothetical protein [Streptosporangiales bacterium]
MGTRASRRAAVAAAAACATALAGGLALAAPANAAAVPAAPFDFNGDGKRDLAIGSPDASVATQAGAGLVTIVYSDANGPNTAQRRVISQYGAAVPDEPEAGDKFGRDLDSADFDLDGFADLVIGVPGETLDGVDRAGMVIVAHGSPTGFSDFVAIRDSTEHGSARMGESLTAGDIDNDGRADITVSSPGSQWLTIWSFTPPEGSGAKTASRPTRVPLPWRTTVKPQAIGAEFHEVDSGDIFGDAGEEVALLWRDEQGGDPFEQGAVALMYFDGTEITWTEPIITTGHSLEVGNLDGAARPELAVGQYSDAGHRGGQITIWQPGTAPTYLTGARRINQDSTGIPGVGETGDRFGQSLAIGDADNDGRGDLAVGVPGEDLPGGADAGAVVFLYGSASAPDTARTWAINQETSNIPGGSEASDRFGHGVSVLDFTTDGKSELTVGSAGENGTEGLVTLLRGGLTSVGARAFGPQAVGVTTTARLGSTLGH